MPIDALVQIDKFDNCYCYSAIWLPQVSGMIFSHHIIMHYHSHISSSQLIVHTSFLMRQLANGLTMDVSYWNILERRNKKQLQFWSNGNKYLLSHTIFSNSLAVKN